MSYDARVNVDQTAQTLGSQGASRGNKGGTQRGKTDETTETRQQTWSCTSQQVEPRRGCEKRRRCAEYPAAFRSPVGVAARGGPDKLR